MEIDTKKITYIVDAIGAKMFKVIDEHQGCRITGDDHGGLGRSWKRVDMKGRTVLVRIFAYIDDRGCWDGAMFEIGIHPQHVSQLWTYRISGPIDEPDLLVDRFRLLLDDLYHVIVNGKQPPLAGSDEEATR